MVTFKDAADDLEIDRTGLERKTYEILGAQIPHMEIPLPWKGYGSSWKWLMVQAARNLGHDSATDFNEKLLKIMSKNGNGQVKFSLQYCISRLRSVGLEKGKVLILQPKMFKTYLRIDVNKL